MTYALKTLFFCWIAAALLIWAAVYMGLPMENGLADDAQPATDNGVLAIILLILAMFAFTAPFVMFFLHLTTRTVFTLAGYGEKELLAHDLARLERRLEQERLSYRDYRTVEELEKSVAEKKAALEKLRGTSSR